MKVRWIAALISGVSLGGSLLAQKPTPSTKAGPVKIGGVERWSIKVGSDAAANNITATKSATVADLTDPAKTPRPSDWPVKRDPLPKYKTSRIAPTEKTFYIVDADILRFKTEAPPGDSDFHIVIKDHSDSSATPKTMIVEIPHPQATGMSASAWKDKIAAARQAFDDKFHPTGKLHPNATNKNPLAHARITGVGFFDHDHRQNGVAKTNAIELHPILRVEFLP